MKSPFKAALTMAVVLVGATATAIPVSAHETDAPAKEPLYSQYTVRDGDTLDLVAGINGETVDELKASNNVDAIKPGDTLLVSSVHPAIVYTVAAGDMLSVVCQRYQCDTDQVIRKNRISTPDLIQPGQVFVLPGAKAPPPPPPVETSPQPQPGPAPVMVETRPRATTSGNHFAYGYCTFYVASRRPVPWFGDAGQWYRNAQAMGYAVGSAPRPGAIMVTWESAIGHVAYVESVGGDGSWTVSEMNYKGWNVVSYRTIRPGTIPLIGFIY